MPYSLSFGMGCTLVGLVLLATAHHYSVLLMGAACVGFGSSVFHPEASRVARLASGGKHGFAQSLFQVGGNFGSSIGPLLAAFVVLPFGQISVSWFSVWQACCCSGMSATGTIATGSPMLAGRSLTRRCRCPVTG
jgi:FSR family fosmidomycin resistance protein-like MFS transporter